jgi:hypothetical protein
MAIEAKRGCGYRKVGGTYMVSGNFMQACDRLPFELTVCPCCGEGYRPSRQIRKINPNKMLDGVHQPCMCSVNCFMCNPVEPNVSEQVGHYLEWIGGGFYKTARDFAEEANELGISRRLKSGIPRDLVVGQSIIFLAHRKTTFSTVAVTESGRRRRGPEEYKPAIFSAFVASKLEHLCTETEKGLLDSFKELSKEDQEKHKDKLDDRVKELLNLEKRGVHLIAVPDKDPDHRR